MRILSLIAVVVFVGSLAVPARAGMGEDCIQESDLDLKIRGCTAMISSGQFEGKLRAGAYALRGVAYGRLGDYARAIKDFDQVLLFDPGYAEGYLNRGIAYDKLNERRRAIEDYDQALRLDPDNITIRGNRGRAYSLLAWDLYLNGRNTKALTDVVRSLSDLPDHLNAIDTHAHVLAALGRPGEALAEFERVVELGGVNWVRNYQEALIEHGYYRGAIDGTYGQQTRAALVACLDAGAGCWSDAEGLLDGLRQLPVWVIERPSRRLSATSGMRR
jgi:tetratricopeptide (TPR) repeat protein